jgi:hypothetical protein
LLFIAFVKVKNKTFENDRQIYSYSASRHTRVCGLVPIGTESASFSEKTSKM